MEPVLPQPEIDERLRSLLARDFLYEHPASYRAGIQAALHALRDSHPGQEADAPAKATA